MLGRSGSDHQAGGGLRKRHGAGVRFHVFTGRTDACQEDVILGEGLAMRFLTPDEIATKELVSNAHMFLSLV